MPFRALILDFDGLIRDTETPRLRSWQDTFRRHGHEFDMALYRNLLGTRGITVDLLGDLERLVGRPLDRETIDRERVERREALLALEAVRPGIGEHVRDARAMGLLTGIASSSARDSVIAQLEALSLSACWDGLCFGDEVKAAKPDPEIYLAITERLGVRPREAIAYEDSPNGIRSAREAGLRVVAVPNDVTRHLDLSEAHLIIESLGTVGLREVMARLGSS